MNCASDKKVAEKDMLIDPRKIAPDLSDTAVEGRHYYRNMKINKDIFVPQYNIGL